MIEFAVYFLAAVGIVTIGSLAITRFITWGDETRTRRREADQHRAAVTRALERIEAAIIKSNNSAR